MIDLNTAPITSLDDLAARIKNPFQIKINPLGDKGRDFPQGFQIVEIINGTPQAAIVLAGNMMPMIPFEWGGEQRLVKEYYPGNPEPATQVMGPKEDTVPVKGRLKDKRYRDTSWYGVAYQYSIALDKIRKRGNLVKFGMVGESGSWTRYGFLERTKWKMEKLSWIDYELDFFVVSETLPVNNFFAADSKDAPNAANAALLAAVAKFQSDPVLITVPRSIADVLNGLISDVGTQVNKVINFVDAAIGAVEGIEGSANRALGLIKNAKTSLVNFSRRVDVAAHNFTSLTSQTDYASQVRDTFRNLSYLDKIGKRGLTIAQYLAQLEAQIRAIVVTLPMTRAKVGPNDTLQSLAIKYYGAPDNWKRIMDHNKLQSTTLVPGKVLEIPHL